MVDRAGQRINDWIDNRTSLQVYVFGLCLGFTIGFCVAMAATG